MELFVLRELSDIFVDACLRDEAGRLLLLSCYGRDTALQQLFASFSLPVSQGGFDVLRLVGEDGCEHRVSVEQTQTLKKVSGRLPKANLFGNLAQVWILDEALTQPDRVNRIGWVLSDRQAEQADRDARVWEMVVMLSPVPLLAHWRDAVLDALVGSVAHLRESAYVPLGRVDAVRVHVPDTFPESVTELVRARKVVLEADQQPSAAQQV